MCIGTTRRDKSKLGTFDLLDDVDGSDKDANAVVALGLVCRALAKQEGVVACKVSVVLHARATSLHSLVKMGTNIIKKF